MGYDPLIRDLWSAPTTADDLIQLGLPSRSRQPSPPYGRFGGCRVRLPNPN